MGASVAYRGELPLVILTAFSSYRFQHAEQMLDTSMSVLHLNFPAVSTVDMLLLWV